MLAVLAENKMTDNEVKGKIHSCAAYKAAVKCCAGIFGYFELSCFYRIIDSLKQHRRGVTRYDAHNTVGNDEVIQPRADAAPVRKQPERDHCGDYPHTEHYAVQVKSGYYIIRIHK